MKISIPKMLERVSSPENVDKLITAILANESEIDREKEHFWVIGCTSQNTIKYIELVHLGGLNNCGLDIKTIMRAAINYGVVSIIIAHNHPGGECKASEADIISTGKIKKACETLEIELLDHIVHSRNGFYSFKEDGRI